MSDPRVMMPAPAYHAIKALSAGMIWTMDSECALKAWLASPWNPNREAVNNTHFDVGTAAHLAVLEPHLLAERAVLHGFDDYRTNAAKEARDGAYRDGKTPLKPAEWGVVEGVQQAIQEHRGAAHWFAGTLPEVTLTWEWNGMLCKCRPDALAVDNSYVLDLKTANTCNPRAIARKAFNEGWFVRAAWYMAGVKEATGTLPDKYLFVAVEKDAPYIVEIYELDQRSLMLGDQIIGKTLGRTLECFNADRWPGYGDGGVTTLQLPSWQMAERAEEFNE